MSEPASEFYSRASSRTIAVGPTLYSCRRFGSGPDLLLVHGFPLSGFTWRKVLPELSKSYTCHVPDLAGMGHTQWSETSDLSWHGHARSLKGLADALDLKRYGVLAQNTGGTFARCLALMDSRVDKLALLNTEMPGHRPPWIPLYQFLMGVPGTVTAFRVLLRSPAFLRSRMGFGGCFVDLDLIGGDFHEHVVAPLLRDPRRMSGMRQYLRALRDWGVVDAMAQDHARIAIPVQLVWGADDSTFPVALAREMARQFPRATLAEIPGAKLLVHEEKPAEVARVASAFFAAPG